MLCSNKTKRYMFAQLCLLHSICTNSQHYFISKIKRYYCIISIQNVRLVLSFIHAIWKT